MKDILQDIVSHTQNLGFITTVKVTGTEEKTIINSIADDRSVIMEAETANPYPDMIGIFGMPQLNKLKYLLDGAVYKEGAKIEVKFETRNDETAPVGIRFENKDGDVKNDYGFMRQEIIAEKMKTVKFRGVKWDVELEPTVESIQRFKFQAGANNESPTFLAKTEGGNLKFIFGNAGSHAGEFVFASGVTGKLDRGWTWPVTPILSILNIADANNAKMSLSNEGAIQITLDSGLATYKYIILAVTT
jgi:hypothetical protein